MSHQATFDPSDFVLRITTLENTVRLLAEEPRGEYVTWYEASLVQMDEDDKEHIAGSMRGLVIDVQRALNDGAELQEDCDADDGTTHEFAASCLTQQGLIKPTFCAATDLGYDSGNVLGIAYVALRPAWRGHRLGLLFLRRFIDRVARGCNLVVCKPAPLSPDGEVGQKFQPPETSVKVATAALRRYVERLGFVRVGKTPYHALSLEHVQRSAQSLLEEVEPAPQSSSKAPRRRLKVH